MELPYSEQLEIQKLGNLFSNTSECYKFFWFQAILSKIEESKSIITYEELVDDMIASAWYMVSECHLNLGPKDNLERVVTYLHEHTDIKPSEKKAVVIKYLKGCEDKEVNRLKRELIKNVPYRLQVPFLLESKSKDLDVGVKRQIEIINREKRLMYYFGVYEDLDTRIEMQEEWFLYLQKNLKVIQGWLKFNMIKYLQRRNPTVPGIVDKLSVASERESIDKVKKYWRLVIDISRKEAQPIHEIYGNQILSLNDVSIDHFVPWSYVANDELWNLHPTTKSINSSKSNCLPDWEKYFPLLSKQEYNAYLLTQKFDIIRAEFNKCADNHLNNEDVRYRLYKENQDKEMFMNQLQEILLPVYQSAKNCGFENWVY